MLLNSEQKGPPTTASCIAGFNSQMYQVKKRQNRCSTCSPDNNSSSSNRFWVVFFFNVFQICISRQSHLFIGIRYNLGATDPEWLSQTHRTTLQPCWATGGFILSYYRSLNLCKIVCLTTLLESSPYCQSITTVPLTLR